MEVLFYVMIGLFVLDIICGTVNGIIDEKRMIQTEKRLSLLEAYFDIFDDELSDDIFPDFDNGGE